MPEQVVRYGSQPNDASALTRKCRLLQSWYRVEVAGQTECGPWRVGASPVGSSLVGGEVSGANFISPAAFAYAREKVAEKRINPDLTIDEHRLFNNMLSSQPMCFNLLADVRFALQANWPGTTHLLAAMFAESRMARIKSVDVEMIPRPVSAYVDDKTAFDALILFDDKHGNQGMAAIETKYTDKLGGNIASKQDRKFALAANLQLLTKEGTSWYRERGFDQIARNLLLTLAFAHRHGIHTASNYVLGPINDVQTPRMVADLNAHLTPAYQNCVKWLPLEDAVKRGLTVADAYFGDHLHRFHRRYLDFSQIEHLLGAPRSLRKCGLPQT